MLLKGVDDLDEFVESIHRAFVKPLRINGNVIKIDFSIGAAKYLEDAKNISELITNANTAMQLAKHESKRGCLEYQSYMSDELSKQHLLLEALKDSIEHENFTPYFQPKVDISQQNRIVGFEALVRWENQGEMIPPSFFLPLASEQELLGKIDYIMLKKSLQQLKEWHESGYKVEVSVNFISEDFSDVSMYALLQEYEEYLPYLTIEITEGEIMNIADDEIQKLQDFKKLSVRISLDDFGTGYSSLSYIHKFPIDELKIDKSFVDTVPGSPKDEALVKIIKSIADTFECNCVVEGVETQEQSDFFKKLGTYIIQGFFYYKPLSPKEATLALEGKFTS